MTEIAFIDLFSGIGGFAEGFRRAGLKFKFHAFSEIDKNAINIYKKHFPNAQGVGDVRTVKSFSELKNRRGGYPWLSLSDFLVKIYRLLEKDKVLPAIEAACSLKRSVLSENLNLRFLSLKTSKVCCQATEEQTLSDVCGKLPTLGFMSASGNLLILPGYYPKIASEFTLSDVLESSPGDKYFLSSAAVERLMSYKGNRQILLPRKTTQTPETDRILLKVNRFQK